MVLISSWTDERPNIYSVANPGFSGGPPTSEGRCQPIIWPIFPQTAWKWTNFGPRGASFPSPRSAPDIEVNLDVKFNFLQEGAIV